MAAPGEYFPQAFAGQILSLATQVKQKNAELAEMRRSRAANEFLEKARIDAQKKRAEIEAATRGRQFESNEAIARIESEADLRKLEFEEKRRQEASEQTGQNALQTLVQKGFAFVPHSAVGGLAGLQQEGLNISTIQQPDGSVMAFQTDKFGKAKVVQEQERSIYEKRLELYQESLAADKAELDLQSERARLKNLQNGLNPARARHAMSQFRLFQSMIDSQLDSLKTRALNEDDTDAQALLKRVNAEGAHVLLPAGTPEKPGDQERYLAIKDLATSAQSIADLPGAPGDDDPRAGGRWTNSFFDTFGPAYNQALAEDPVDIALRSANPLRALASQTERVGKFTMSDQGRATIRFWHDPLGGVIPLDEGSRDALRRFGPQLRLQESARSKSFWDKPPPEAAPAVIAPSAGAPEPRAESQAQPAVITEVQHGAQELETIMRARMQTLAAELAKPDIPPERKQQIFDELSKMEEQALSTANQILR